MALAFASRGARSSSFHGDNERYGEKTRNYRTSIPTSTLQFPCVVKRKRDKIEGSLFYNPVSLMKFRITSSSRSPTVYNLRIAVIERRATRPRPIEFFRFLCRISSCNRSSPPSRFQLKFYTGANRSLAKARRPFVGGLAPCIPSRISLGACTSPANQTPA